MDKKRAQTTLFIFIGVIILFSVVAIVFFKSNQVRIEKIPQITEETPTEMQPVRAFVQECVAKTATEAVKLIGMHGGYISLEPEDYIYTNQLFSTEPEAFNPTEYDALTISSDWKIPYWWYLKSKNTCTDSCEFTSLRPSLRRTDPDGEKSIESQIDRYVEKNLDKCLGNFASFSQKGMEITEGQIKTTTTIAEKDINVFVELPLDAKWGGGESKLSQFSSQIDINLKNIYNLATAIVNTEKQSPLLELNTLNVISAFSGMDQSKLPPPSGTELRMTSRVWTKRNTAEKLTGLLSIYISAIQVQHTSNYELRFNPDSPLATGLYGSMIIPLEGYYYGLEANLNYFGWPIYFYITKGEIIKARESIDIPLLSALIPIQRYDFPYDVSFPVMVHLRDPAAMKGAGYDFFFALESNVRNNKAMQISGSGLAMSGGMSSRVQLCNDNSRDSGEITIRAEDTKGNPVDKAQILFSIGGITCLIGQTEKEGDAAVFRGKFPTGAIGALTIMNPDYETYTKKFFSPKKDAQDLGTIKMKAYVLKNVSAKVMDINKVSVVEDAGPFPLILREWSLLPVKQDIASKDHVVVVLERIKDDPLEDDVVAAADINGTDTKQMRLLPGKYHMSVTFIEEDTTITIPKEKICEGSSSFDFGLGEDECEDVGPTKITKNEPFTTQYEIDVEFTGAIYNADKDISFTGLNFNLQDAEDKVHEDLQEWSKVQKQVNNDPDLFMPELVKNG